MKNGGHVIPKVPELPKGLLGNAGLSELKHHVLARPCNAYSIADREAFDVMVASIFRVLRILHGLMV